MSASEPISVVHAFIAAENAHDIEGATALFAEDGVAELAVETHTGHDQICGWQQSLAAGGFHIERIGDPQVQGNTVTFHSRVDLKMFHDLGLGIVEAISEVVVEEGRIKRYAFTLTPEYGAKLQKAIRGG